MDNSKNERIVMNWKEHVNLFANGRFRVRISSRKRPLPFTGLYKIEGTKEPVVRTGCGSYHVSKCTLIARPISDMTDEEMEEFRRIAEEISIPFTLNQLKSDKRPMIEQDASQLMYLLSIGVYPFDQSDFGDTVIDATT